VTPLGFQRKIAALGIAEVRFAYHWHEDEMKYDVQALDATGTLLSLPHPLVGEIEEALAEQAQDGYGTYRWDVQANTVEPFGRLDYLFGDSLSGVVAYVYDEDAQLVRRVQQWTPEDGTEEVQTWARSWDPEVRRAVAHQPLIPPDLRLPLLGDTAPEVRAAAQPHLPLDEVAPLLRALHQAQQPHTLPRELHTLSGSQYGQVRLAVARNPSTAAATLRELVSDEWPIQVALLNNPSCPEPLRQAVLDQVAAIPVVRARLSLMESAELPGALLERWQADPDPVIRARIAQQPHVSEATLLALAADSHGEVWAAAQAVLAEREPESGEQSDWETVPELTPEQQWQVINSWRRGNNAYLLAQDQHLLPEILDHLVHDPQRASYVAHRADLSEEQLATIVQRGNVGARETVASNPALPLPLLRQLAQDVSEFVREAVVQQGRLSSALLPELARDPEFRVRQAVARHSATPPEVLEQLAQDRWLARDVVMNPQVPLKLLHHIMTGPQAPDIYPWLLTEARPEVLGALSLYATGERLGLMAQNERTPEVDLIPLFRSLVAQGVDPIAHLLADPATPASTLERLVASPHDQALLRHPQVNATVVRRLVQVYTTRFVFYNFWEQQKMPLLHTLLNSPFLTEPEWHSILDSPTKTEVRVAIAAHSNTPESVLRRLFADPLQQVARMATRHPRLPQDLRNLIRFSECSSEV
jgi:hypothetical protein